MCNVGRETLTERVTEKDQTRHNEDLITLYRCLASLKDYIHSYGRGRIMRETGNFK